MPHPRPNHRGTVSVDGSTRSAQRPASTLETSAPFPLRHVELQRPLGRRQPAKPRDDATRRQRELPLSTRLGWPARAASCRSDQSIGRAGRCGDFRRRPWCSIRSGGAPAGHVVVPPGLPRARLVLRLDVGRRGTSTVSYGALGAGVCDPLTRGSPGNHRIAIVDVAEKAGRRPGFLVNGMIRIGRDVGRDVPFARQTRHRFVEVAARHRLVARRPSIGSAISRGATGQADGPHGRCSRAGAGPFMLQCKRVARRSTIDDEDVVALEHTKSLSSAGAPTFDAASACDGDRLHVRVVDHRLLRAERQPLLTDASVGGFAGAKICPTAPSASTMFCRRSQCRSADSPDRTATLQVA